MRWILYCRSVSIIKVVGGTISAGMYEVVYLGRAAGLTGILSSGGAEIFSTATSAIFASNQNVVFGNDTFLKDTPNTNNLQVNIVGNNHTSLKTQNSFHLFYLANDVTFTNNSQSMLFNKGQWAFIGWNDSATVDTDYNDMFLALRTVATPIPGAAWLFGSGLMGLVALERRLRAA